MKPACVYRHASCSRRMYSDTAFTVHANIANSGNVMMCNRKSEGFIKMIKTQPVRNLNVLVKIQDNPSNGWSDI